MRTHPHPTLDETKLCCPFCGLYQQIQGLGQHVKSHVRAGVASAVFSSPFPCLACRHRTLDAEQDVMIDGCPAWNAHVSSAHGRVAESWSVGDSWEPGNKPKNQFMCLLCTVLLSGRTSLTQHYKRTHVRKGTFDRHFPCPECRRSRSDEPDQIITSASSRSNHVEKVHGINYTPLLRTDVTAKEAKSRCPFCGLCFDQRGFYAHFRSHVRDGAASDIFTSAFPCLRCNRDEQAARETERVRMSRKCAQALRFLRRAHPARGLG